jgi:hypothetical protein
MQDTAAPRLSFSSSWYIKRGNGTARASGWARSRRLGRSWRLCFDPAQEGTGRRKRRQKRARARAQRERTRERASERGRGAETKKSEVTRRENPQGRDAPQNVSRTSCTLVRAYARLGGTLLVSECEDSGARVCERECFVSQLVSECEERALLACACEKASRVAVCPLHTRWHALGRVSPLG